ncbi:MAG: 50S ribosomal protein L35 [Chloroflexi bacterium]|nr:50S ribosomal protein L35 [Chloroflexota bacterium]
MLIEQRSRLRRAVRPGSFSFAQRVDPETDGVNSDVGKKYKLKTHKATAKRFRVTGGGKVVRTKGGKSHFRRRTSTRVKQKLDKMLVVRQPAEARRIRRLAPYLGLYKQNPPG